jgi:adenylyl-sulfate kinase
MPKSSTPHSLAPNSSIPNLLIPNSPMPKSSPTAAGAVVWLTGLSGAGKSTLAQHLAAALQADGHRVALLDGDVLRLIFPGTGFDRAARSENVRRAGHLAAALERDGWVVIAALISPYVDARAAARALCGDFIEVFVDTSLAECERRDPKGLYARARAGALSLMSGLDEPYESPSAPDLHLATAGRSVPDCAAQLIDFIRARLR